MAKDKKRIRAREFGIFAEEKVAEEYARRGYTILAKNWIIGKTPLFRAELTYHQAS